MSQSVMQGSIHKLIIYFTFIFFLCRSTAAKKPKYVYGLLTEVEGKPLWLYVGSGSTYRATSYLVHRPTPPKGEDESLSEYFKVPTTQELVNRVWAVGLPLTIYVSLVPVKHALTVEAALIKELISVHNLKKDRVVHQESAGMARHFVNPTFGGELFCEQIYHS